MSIPTAENAGATEPISSAPASAAATSRLRRYLQLFTREPPLRVGNIRSPVNAQAFDPVPASQHSTSHNRKKRLKPGAVDPRGSGSPSNPAPIK